MPAMKIHGSEYALSKVFSDDFAFEIPHYQRPYAWSTDEAGELLDDLATALGDDDEEPIDEIPPYFLGCIVLLKPEGQVEAQVVDGQQRLTTLTILLAALRATVEAKGEADALTQFLYAKGNPMLETEQCFRLRVRERDREFFESYVQHEDGPAKLTGLDTARLESVSARNCAANAIYLLQRLRDLPDVRRGRLARFLLQRCVLVVVSSPDLDSAYRIFSVLNNRGLDLSHTDILKAEIIGKVPAHESESYSERWEDAENALGVERFKDLFAHIRMIYRRQKMRTTVLQEFREHVVSKHRPEELIDDILCPLGDAYLELSQRAYKSSKSAEKVNRLLGWVSRIDNADWIPPALLMLRKGHDDPDGLVRFLTDLERLAASMLIRRVNITKRIDRYGKLLGAMHDGTDLYASGSPLQLAQDEQKDTLRSLNGSIYQERNVPLYVLLRLDSWLAGAGAIYEHEIISIEHVLPQSPEPHSEWVTLFPDETDRWQLVHRLGNLVLLSRRKNSSARNWDFDTKKRKYFTGADGTSPFALTTQVLREPSWTPEVVKRRQQELVGALGSLWRLDGEIHVAD
jgi:hypothetical protein